MQTGLRRAIPCTASLVQGQGDRVWGDRIAALSVGMAVTVESGPAPYQIPHILQGRDPPFTGKETGLRITGTGRIWISICAVIQSLSGTGNGRQDRMCGHAAPPTGLSACAAHLDLETLHTSGYIVATSSCPLSHQLQPLPQPPRNPTACDPATKGLCAAQVGTPGPMSMGQA